MRGGKEEKKREVEGFKYKFSLALTRIRLHDG